MIDYNPEKHKGDNFNTLQHLRRARWHDKDKVLVLLYYKTPRVQKVKHCFKGVTMGRLRVKMLAGSKLPAHPSPLLRLFP